MGKAFSKIFESLNPFVISRRDEKHSVHRTRSDHPERICPDQRALITDIERTLNSSSSSVIPKEAMSNTTLTAFEVLTIPLGINVGPPPPPKCSDFYLACRNNKIQEVKKMLETISQDEIDRLEPNGSTALHAACFHGHVDIVRLLLDRGADRSIQNKFQCLPFDEALTEEIKELFLRMPNGNRLVTDIGTIEWELVSDDALENASIEREAIKSLYNNTTGSTPIHKMFEKIQNYIEKRLANTDKIDKIKHFFEKATKEQDPIWIIKAYTAETDFYNILNAEIATGASMYQNERKYIIALLSYHPSLDKLSYIGTSYRVMKVSEYDIQKYEINRLSMTKSFLSSSIDEKIAVWYLSRQESAQENKGTNARLNKHGKVIKSWVMCKYQIKHPRTALHIENSSQYPVEGEVLIMPYTVFKIKNTRTMTTSYLLDNQMITEIEFEECSSVINIKISFGNVD
jgi:hypothetical protein